MITLINGHLQGPSNIVVPNGTIELSLSQDATVLLSPYGQVLAGFVVMFGFDSIGDILPGSQIYSNAELEPNGTYYLVNFYDVDGARVNASPFRWQFSQSAGATVDISAQINLNAIGNTVFVPIPGPPGSGTVTIAATQVAFGGAVANTINGTNNFTYHTSTGDLTLTAPSGSERVFMVPGTGTGFQTTLFANQDGSFQIIPGATGTTQFSLTVSGMGIAASNTQGTLLTFLGASSGFGSIGVANVAGSPNRLNLPTSTGAAGSFLQTDGGSPQQLSWTASTGISGTIAANQIAVGNGVDTIGGSSSLTFNPASVPALYIETSAPGTGPNLQFHNSSDAAGTGFYITNYPGQYVLYAQDSAGHQDKIFFRASPAGFYIETQQGLVNVEDGGGNSFSGIQFIATGGHSAQIGISTAAYTAHPLVLPVTTGTNGQVLQTDGNNPQQLSWVTTPSGTIGGTIATNQVAFGTGANTIGGSANFTWNNGTQALNIAGVAGSGFIIDSGGDAEMLGGTISTGFVAHSATNVGVSSILYTVSIDPGSTGTGGLQIAHNLGSGPAMVWDNSTGYFYLRKSTGLAGIGVATAAGSPAVILLPTSTGTSGAVLTTDGNSPQQTSWVASQTIRFSAGTVTAGSFGGPFTVSFVTPFADDNYTVEVTAVLGENPTGSPCAVGGVTKYDTPSAGAGVQVWVMNNDSIDHTVSLNVIARHD